MTGSTLSDNSYALPTLTRVRSTASAGTKQPYGAKSGKRFSRSRTCDGALRHVLGEGTIFGEIFNVTGGGKWVEIAVHADPLYLHLLLTAEKKFWRCVMSGEEPRLFGVEPPRPRLEAVRIVDMSASNSWAAFAAVYRRTWPAYQEHEGAKADLKKLVPEDAKEAIGHGLRAKRLAISFDLVDAEAADAPLQ